MSQQFHFRGFIWRKQTKKVTQKDTCSPKIIKCPLTDEWIKKTCYLYNRVLWKAMKRMKYFHWQWQGWILRVTKTELYNLTYMWNIKRKRKNPQNQAHKYREQKLVANRSGGWGWAKWVKGVRRYKILVIK